MAIDVRLFQTVFALCLANVGLLCFCCVMLHIACLADINFDVVSTSN